MFVDFVFFVSYIHIYIQKQQQQQQQQANEQNKYIYTHTKTKTKRERMPLSLPRMKLSLLLGITSPSIFLPPSSSSWSSTILTTATATTSTTTSTTTPHDTTHQQNSEKKQKKRRSSSTKGARAVDRVLSDEEQFNRCEACVFIVTQMCMHTVQFNTEEQTGITRRNRVKAGFELHYSEQYEDVCRMERMERQQLPPPGLTPHCKWFQAEYVDDLERFFRTQRKLRSVDHDCRPQIEKFCENMTAECPSGVAVPDEFDFVLEKRNNTRKKNKKKNDSNKIENNKIGEKGGTEEEKKSTKETENNNNNHVENAAAVDNNGEGVISTSTTPTTTTTTTSSRKQTDGTTTSPENTHKKDDEQQQPQQQQDNDDKKEKENEAKAEEEEQASSSSSSYLIRSILTRKGAAPPRNPNEGLPGYPVRPPPPPDYQEPVLRGLYNDPALGPFKSFEYRVRAKENEELGMAHWNANPAARGVKSGGLKIDPKQISSPDEVRKGKGSLKYFDEDGDEI